MSEKVYTKAEVDKLVAAERGKMWDATVAVICDGSTNRDHRTGHAGCWARHQHYILAALATARSKEQEEG